MKLLCRSHLGVLCPYLHVSLSHHFECGDPAMWPGSMTTVQPTKCCSMYVHIQEEKLNPSPHHFCWWLSRSHILVYRSTLTYCGLYNKARQVIGVVYRRWHKDPTPTVSWSIAPLSYLVKDNKKVNVHLKKWDHVTASNVVYQETSCKAMSPTWMKYGWMYTWFPRYIITMPTHGSSEPELCSSKSFFFSWYNQAVELTPCGGVVLLISVSLDGRGLGRVGGRGGRPLVVRSLI